MPEIDHVRNIVGPTCTPEIQIPASWLTPAADQWLVEVGHLLPDQGGFWYLAGPMSGRPGFNFHEFDRVAALLRSQAYPIVSPAEFEHEQTRKTILEANGDEPHDSVGPAWEDCIARDLCIVAHPRCVGIILLREWQDSAGARLETLVAEALGKPLFEFSEDPMQLTQIKRDEGLRQWDEAH